MQLYRQQCNSVLLGGCSCNGSSIKTNPGQAGKGAPCDGRTRKAMDIEGGRPQAQGPERRGNPEVQGSKWASQRPDRMQTWRILVRQKLITAVALLLT